MKILKQYQRDFSFSALTSAVVIALVGMASSAILVFQEAAAFGVSSQEASSWLGSLCVGMGILTILLSTKYRVPVMIAWSTPGAALLISSAAGFTLPQAIGAFVFSAILMILSGATGVFEKIMNRVPQGLSAALLAGVLLSFTVNAVTAFNTQSILIAAMFVAYVVGKKYSPNFTMLFVLVTGISVSAALKLLRFENLSMSATEFTWTWPEFSISALLSIGLPLFVVTMASQNITGFAIMRSYGYLPSVSKILTKTGILNLITAFFGGFAVNLAAVTAAIAMSADCNPNKDRRYMAAVISGVFYIIIGFMAGAITSVFSAFPQELVIAIAGFALFGTVSASLQKALSQEEGKEATFITFVIAASGFKFLNIGSAFWSLVIGGLVLYLMRPKPIEA
ncbi:benzoate/H(+) symporter BenE family transporter [Pseudobdellovibrio exovorus]|uniref:Benzoate membrane transport protein n=1 Tax=Pseudobdellovibrio exovorus JSS TaxID=1184267 RepID=M4VMR6_9BACT|nr:benzoate/H(+) symporter BenE family transporter [Pseudobdellovibrio exovorus]AGH94379.1 hypothetical protein A11Q_159 [Pseudobdellovibrio exovorus JSS]